MTAKDKQLKGREGEDAACAYLKEKGYRITATNFRTRSGEIDIVALDGNVICFVEVKARSSTRFGTPSEAVTERKRGQMTKAARYFLKHYGATGNACRFDVVSVMLDERGKAEKVELLKNAFEVAQ